MHAVEEGQIDPAADVAAQVQVREEYIAHHLEQRDPRLVGRDVGLKLELRIDGNAVPAGDAGEDVAEGDADLQVVPHGGVAGELGQHRPVMLTPVLAGNGVSGLDRCRHQKRFSISSSASGAGSDRARTSLSVSTTRSGSSPTR